MKRIFIDGSAGTTGLRIHERLSQIDNIALITLSEKRRKDPDARARALNAADIAVLCLPDDAAQEAVSMVKNPDTVIIDASTAHRTSAGWTYGFPEAFPGREAKLGTTTRISVPGCHASGYIALTAPLVRAGILLASAVPCVCSLTGYSGGGKKMIAEYTDAERSPLLSAPRPYALGQTHKHLAEMKKQSGMHFEPVFMPVVADFYSGMLTSVMISRDMLAFGAGIEDVRAVLSSQYTGDIVQYDRELENAGIISASTMSGSDGMKITVTGNSDRMELIALFDNLGKGASGAAVQCVNIVCGEDMCRGLKL